MLKCHVTVSGPIAVDIAVNRDVLAKYMGDAAPKGKHPHDPPGWTTKRGDRPRRGDNRLSNWLGKVQNWHMLGSSKKPGSRKGAYCNVFLAYALIQNIGGQIPAYKAMYIQRRGRVGNKRKGLMTWVQGGTVFAWSRKSYTIKGQHYIEKGVSDFINREDAITVEWQPGPPKTYATMQFAGGRDL